MPPIAPAAATLTFDHIGLVTPTLTEGRLYLQRMLGISLWTEPVEDPGIGVYVQFGAQPGNEAGNADATNGPTYELVAPLTESSPVSQALRSGKNILHHVAYRTPDLLAASSHLIAEGCRPVALPQPAVAYGGALVQFLVSPLRFLVELVEAPEHRHNLLPRPLDPLPEAAA